ncbi:MAG: translation initiation factor IF-2 [Candidatus Gracilibacteria bacterium]|nr:translation initiation factor IF-2 [Candidatus Gracilibacteria bacterium]MDD2909075.1 translation initiation factor IF-2 [Candidatus Gracilibacteria bacterium]
MTPKDTNIDDYYSNIPQAKNEDTDEKKSPFKLKLKIKKVEEDSAVLDVSEKKEEIDNQIQEETKIKIKKQPTIITFEERKELPKIEKQEFKSNFRSPDRTEPRREFNPANRTEPRREFRPNQQTPRPTTPYVRPETKSEEKPFFRKPTNLIQFEPAREITPKAPDSVSIDSESLERFSSNKKSFGDKKPTGTTSENTGPKKTFFGDKKPFTALNSPDYGKFKSKKTLKTRGFFDEDDGSFRRSKKQFIGNKEEKNIDELKQTLSDKSGQEVNLPDFLTVKEFSDKIGIPAAKVIGEFLKNGMMATLNTRVDFDTCYIIAEVFNIKVAKEQSGDVSITSVMEGNLIDLLKNDDTSKMSTRAPIISIMGHVDHGKTSILDYIRKTEVASGEAGGITQKIGAYQVEKNGKKITFLDTPGHEAFSIMRARGAKLTDIAIIVIAADEGMKPQTIESINHAKEAGVPIIIAINKMDKPGANVDLIKGQMSEQGLQPEDWGGDVVVVPVSAHTGLGIDTLLEMIILVSEMQDLKADPTRPAIATVIESHLDSRLGPLATVLVNAGTIKKGDCVVCAASSGRLKFIKDYRGKNIDEAGPSTPVMISGLSRVVEGGDILQVTSGVETAKQKAQEYELTKSSKSLNQFEGASLSLLLNRIKTGNLKQLKVVVKSESNGSLEALKDALGKLGTAEIKIQIIHSGVGEINESDVIMAGTSQAILVGYNVGVVGNAKKTLQNSKIEVINKKVIYHILEKLESIITGMIDIKHDDLDLGEARVKAIFFTSKDKMVVGCELISGKVESKAKIRVVRDSKKAGSGELVSLKSGVIDVNEIIEGEFGIAFKGDVKLEIGDILDFYKVVVRK